MYKRQSSYFCELSNFHFMKFFYTLSGKKITFFSFLVEHFFGVNFGTFSVYVFPKFDEQFIPYD